MTLMMGWRGKALAAAAGVLIPNSIGMTGADVAQASQTQAAGSSLIGRLQGILDGRSPGDRGETQPLKRSRTARSLALATGPEAPAEAGAPSQRVLSLLRERPEGDLPPADIAGVPVGLLPSDNSLTPPGTIPGSGIAPPTTPGISSPPLIGVLPPPNDDDDPIPPPPPPVPEPATWLMMIAGFGAIGAIIRRDGKRRAFARS
jgi:hypothetical protein